MSLASLRTESSFVAVGDVFLCHLHRAHGQQPSPCSLCLHLAGVQGCFSTGLQPGSCMQACSSRALPPSPPHLLRSSAPSMPGCYLVISVLSAHPGCLTWDTPHSGTGYNHDVLQQAHAHDICPRVCRPEAAQGACAWPAEDPAHCLISAAMAAKVLFLGPDPQRTEVPRMFSSRGITPAIRGMLLLRAVHILRKAAWLLQQKVRLSCVGDQGPPSPSSLMMNLWTSRQGQPVACCC